MTTHQSALDYGQRVKIDDDDSLKAIASAFCFRSNNYQTVEVSYICNGEIKTAWVESWRVAAVSEVGRS